MTIMVKKSNSWTAGQGFKMVGSGPGAKFGNVASGGGGGGGGGNLITIPGGTMSLAGSIFTWSTTSFDINSSIGTSIGDITFTGLDKSKYRFETASVEFTQDQFYDWQCTIGSGYTGESWSVGNTDDGAPLYSTGGSWAGGVIGGGIAVSGNISGYSSGGPSGFRGIELDGSQLVMIVVPITIAA